jgi:hypothetical protein
MILSFLNLAACAAVWYSVFCRGVKSDGKVHPEIRRAFVLLSMAAFVAGVIPFVYPRIIIAAPMILAVAITNLQHATGKFWHRGTPEQFANPE